MSKGAMMIGALAFGSMRGLDSEQLLRVVSEIESDPNLKESAQVQRMVQDRKRQPHMGAKQLAKAAKRAALTKATGAV